MRTRKEIRKSKEDARYIKWDEQFLVDMIAAIDLPGPRKNQAHRDAFMRLVRRQGLKIPFRWETFREVMRKFKEYHDAKKAYRNITQ